MSRPWSQVFQDKKIDFFLFFIIILIAATLRFVQLGSVPYGFHSDEVMNGYIGRFIFETGKDIYGNAWPILYFNNFGDYPNVIPMYLSGFFTFIFGVNEFAVRFPIALAGTLTVGLVFLICRWLFKDRWAAVVGGLALAVLPWHIVLSRATAEGITATLFYLAGFTLIFFSLERKQWSGFIVGNLLLLVTYFLYPGFRLLVPLSYLTVLALAFKTRWRYLAFAGAGLFFLLTLLITQTAWGKGRYEQTSIFSHNQEIQGRALRYATGLGPNHLLTARIFHNKYALAGREVIRQYVSYFSPSFWFQETGRPLRYSVPEHGTVYFSVLGLLVLAGLTQFFFPLSRNEVLGVFSHNRSRFFLSYLWLLAVAPVAAMLTLEDVPNVHRATQVGVLITLLLAFAGAYLSKVSYRQHVLKVLLGGFLLVMVLETVYFWHYYTRLSAQTTTLFRAEEQRSLAHFLLDNQLQYDQIIVPSRPATALHYLFHKQDFSSDLAGTFSIGMHREKIDNTIFIDNDCPSSSLPADISLLTPESLIINRAHCTTPPELKEVGTIKYIDQTDAYVLLQLKPTILSAE